MVHGATDDFGWHAVQDKVHVHDLHATILHLMGLDHTRLTYRHAGRDYRLTDVYGNVQYSVSSIQATGPMNAVRGRPRMAFSKSSMRPEGSSSPAAKRPTQTHARRFLNRNTVVVTRRELPGQARRRGVSEDERFT